MTRLLRPHLASYFTCHVKPHRGERFLIEIDESQDVVIAVHLSGLRRVLGLTVSGAKTIAKLQEWREVPRTRSRE